MNDLAARCAPEGVVIAHAQFKRQLAFKIAAPGVGFFDSQAATPQHRHAKRLLVAFTAGGYGNRGQNGAEKADFNRIQVFRLGNGPARASVFHLLKEVLLEGLDAAVGFHIRRGMGEILVGFERQVRQFVRSKVDAFKQGREVDVFGALDFFPSWAAGIVGGEQNRRKTDGEQ